MITYEQARQVLAHALAHARSEDYPPMTVAVLDAASQLVAFGREDGSALLRERITQGKASGALNMGVGSRSLAARAASHPHFVQAVTALAGGELVPVAGGVLVRDPDGAVIGAVGVSGHGPDQDEQCALAGLAAVHLAADPGA